MSQRGRHFRGGRGGLGGRRDHFEVAERDVPGPG